MSDVVAVVVTYNRITLLKESIRALKNQAASLKDIVVVNNGSTDGTREWLESEDGITVIHQKNGGASGGFYSGLKHAALSGATWVWAMDDDTICNSTTLQKLIEKIYLPFSQPIGFLCSKIIWSDGMPHNMNIPNVKLLFNGHVPFNAFDDKDILLTEGCSFVSVLFNVEAIKEVGLPYRQFFIWGDDEEYTRRITKAGYLGIYCHNSIAQHKTPVNHRAYIYTDSPANLWKHEYGFRNEFFKVRRERGWLFYLLYMFARVGYGTLKIIKVRKSDRLKFITTLSRAAWKSLYFHPKIEMLNG